MAGIAQGGILGRLGRFHHEKPLQKKLFGEGGSDLAKVYAKTPTAQQGPTITKGEPNRKGRRKTPTADTALSSDPNNPMGGT